MPVGYADGYPRTLSSLGEMIINGKRAAIAGRICMDQLMLDVTDIDGVHLGTVVTCFGGDNKNAILADEIARLTNTINYEITCDVGKRVPRVFMRNGQEIGSSLTQMEFDFQV